MAKSKLKPYTKTLKDLMDKKSTVLSKAQAFADIGMRETAEPLWATAASYEERIAPLLDSLGRDLEAAVHRISAASCYQKAGEGSRAANLYRAALSGPLRESTRKDVQRMLADCLAQLARASTGSAEKNRSRKATIEA